MPEYSNQVDLHVKVGADYTAQIYWLDDYDNPVPVVGPAKMEVRTNDEDRTLLLTCEDTQSTVGQTTQGQLSLSESSGVIEIYIPAGSTGQMPVGVHAYDLFANYRRYETNPNAPINGPGTALWGDYHVRNVVSGLMIVHPAITDDPPKRTQ